MENLSTILIADDDEVNRTILGQIIEELGYNIVIVENGLEALKLLQSSRIDLVLLDIMMPEMDGYEVLEHIKKDSTLNHVPIIIISAIDEIESIVQCIEMGAEDYLPRPFNKTILKARIGACLEKKALRDKEQQSRKQVEKLLDTIKVELKLGAAIQKRFLTNENETKRIFENIGYNVTIFNKAPSTISGDFYFPKNINLHSAGLFFADVCGHGISAALISMRILSIVDQLRSPTQHASEFMEMVNVDIHGFMPVGHFVAANYLILNQNGYIISNAAQPYPIVISNNEITEVRIDCRPLGQDVNTEFYEVSGNLSSGDKLILYTDGITEAMNESNDIYGEDRLKKCIDGNLNSTLDELKEAIVNDVKTFCGEKMFEDDVTISIFEKM